MANCYFLSFVFIVDHTVIHPLCWNLVNLSKWYALFLKYVIIFKVIRDFPSHLTTKILPWPTKLLHSPDYTLLFNLILCHSLPLTFWTLVKLASFLSLKAITFAVSLTGNSVFPDLFITGPHHSGLSSNHIILETFSLNIICKEPFF